MAKAEGRPLRASDAIINTLAASVAATSRVAPPKVQVAPARSQPATAPKPPPSDPDPELEAADEAAKIVATYRASRAHLLAPLGPSSNRDAIRHRRINLPHQCSAGEIAEANAIVAAHRQQYRS